MPRRFPPALGRRVGFKAIPVVRGLASLRPFGQSERRRPICHQITAYSPQPPKRRRECVIPLTAPVIAPRNDPLAVSSEDSGSNEPYSGILHVNIVLRRDLLPPWYFPLQFTLPSSHASRGRLSIILSCNTATCQTFMLLHELRTPSHQPTPDTTIIIIPTPKTGPRPLRPQTPKFRPSLFNFG